MFSPVIVCVYVRELSRKIIIYVKAKKKTKNKIELLRVVILPNKHTGLEDANDGNDSV